MTPLAWAATAISSAVLAWQAALPAPRLPTVPTARTATDDDTTMLARIEREVTAPLRERESDRWRFSRVHRPTPAYRTLPYPQRTDRRHAAFRILTEEPFGKAERVAWLARVDRTTGAIEVAHAPAPDAKAEPSWQALASVLTGDPGVIQR